MKNRLFSELIWQPTNELWRLTCIWRVKSFVLFSKLFSELMWQPTNELWIWICAWRVKSYEPKCKSNNWGEKGTNMCMKSQIFCVIICDNQQMRKANYHVYEESNILFSYMWQPTLKLWTLCNQLSHRTVEKRIRSSMFLCDNHFCTKKNECTEITCVWRVRSSVYLYVTTNLEVIIFL